MLYLEELVDAVLIEEGQFLMGLSFVVDTLGLTMDKMNILFKKSMLEYARRRPIKATDIMSGNSYIVMPEGTLAVRAVRYGVLPELPRFYMDTFGDVGFEYDRTTRILKVWPPISPVKVTYDKGYTFSDLPVETYITQDEDEDVIVDVLKCIPKKGSISITKGDLSMSEVSRESKLVEDGGVPVKEHVVNLAGDLGTGKIDLLNLEMELELNDTSEGEIAISYTPKYKAIFELDIGDYVFTKLFACKMLEALASLRAQATQEALHQIDLTVDDLYSRVRILKREVKELLRSTISFSGMFNI